MLVVEEYRELIRYRNFPIPRPEGLSHITLQLLNNGFITAVQRREITVEDTIQVERILPYLMITSKGKLALREFEENANTEDKEEPNNAEKHTPDKTKIMPHGRNLMQDFAIATLAAIVAGLFLLYWPTILSALSAAFDKILQAVL